MANGFWGFIKGINLFPTTSGVTNKGDIGYNSSTDKVEVYNGAVDPLVNETKAATGASRLKNKDLDDATSSIVNTSDTSKKILFSAGGGATATATTLASSQTIARTLTFPDATDTLVGKATTDVLTNKSIDATTNTLSNIANASIATAAGIVDTKLATISTSGKVSNSATTATNANTASAIVSRDGSGNFTASTITANLTGNASGTSANVTGVVALVNGGTGTAAASANAAFNALSPMTASGDIIYGGTSGAGTRLPKGANGQVLTLLSGIPAWGTGIAVVAPTVQKFTTGSGTYTTPTSPAPLYIRIRARGGGGSPTVAGVGSGNNGSNTTFGTSLITANGGLGSLGPLGPGGGTATVTTSSTVLQIFAQTGAYGASGTASFPSSGGSGGGEGGGYGGVSGAGNGGPGTTNTGGGGGGGGYSGQAGSAGGGEGGYAEALIISPSSTYSYAVGAGGAANTGGTAGGSGIIIVEEFYQ